LLDRLSKWDSQVLSTIVFYQQWANWLITSQQNFGNHMDLKNGSDGTAPITQVFLDEYLRRQLGMVSTRVGSDFFF